MKREEFATRLTNLRNQKGVSAREMSLELGQNPSYINNIESGRANPSINCFFYICDYLNVTPNEFFETNSNNPVELNKLISKLKRLDAKQLNIVTLFVNEIIK